MFLRLGRICFIFMLFVALSPAIVFAGKPVTITGDPCSLPLAMKLAEAYAKKDKSFSAEAKQVSCMLGVYQAANGDSEIGVSTQNGLSSNLPKKGRNFVLAKAPIVLVVNKPPVVVLLHAVEVILVWASLGSRRGHTTSHCRYICIS